MAYPPQVMPISLLKAKSAEILERLAQDRCSVVITQSGEPKAVLQDIASYQRQQEALALLKMTALGSAQVDAGKARPIRAVIKSMRKRLKSHGRDGL